MQTPPHQNCSHFTPSAPLRPAPIHRRLGVHRAINLLPVFNAQLHLQVHTLSRVDYDADAIVPLSIHCFSREGDAIVPSN